MDVALRVGDLLMERANELCVELRERSRYFPRHH